MKIVLNGETVEVPGGGSDSGIPSGGIIIWSGAADAIPNDWVLCDGENGTPDLRDKFVLGAGTSHPVDSNGGSEKVTLTVDQMPAHSHFIMNNNVMFSRGTNGTASFLSGTGKAQSTAAGESLPHDNMPPYYALCYIMKL